MVIPEMEGAYICSMETIIYLYPMRNRNGEKEYIRQDFAMQDYYLIRVGISVRLLELCQGQMQEKNWEWNHGSPLQGFREWVLWKLHVFRRRKEQREEKELLAHFLQDIWENKEESYFVCEKPMPCFAGWEFRDYFADKWVLHLLQYWEEAKRSGKDLSDMIILGQARCLSEILLSKVCRLKSLQWILPRRQYREEQQELVERLEEEYGLLVDVRILDTEDTFRQFRICCRKRAVILDFCEETRLLIADVAKGSIWLDLSSLEEKRRRIEERNTGIHYFSLKKEWKQPQIVPYYLDTTGKNGYNT